MILGCFAIVLFLHKNNLMEITSYKKETSERSENQNWVLAEIANSIDYYYAGFEGCNENIANEVTSLLDRASIEITTPDSIMPGNDDVYKAIREIENKALHGKIKFCHRLGLPYTYVLYNYGYEIVLRYEITGSDILFKEKYESFSSFSSWIQSIKGWNSGKKFREKQDLPEFDKALRRSGCPWPTNIDCVAFSSNNEPIAIIEFQNAKDTGVEKHLNNIYFLPYRDNRDYKIKRGRDEQRWRSQEILRQQSKLPHLTIVWSQSEEVVVIKILDAVTFPEIKDRVDNSSYAIELNMFRDVISKDPKNMENKFYDSIRNKYQSYNLKYEGDRMGTVINEPPLSYGSKTFPFIYGRRIITSKKGSVKEDLEGLLSSLGNGIY